MPRGSLFEAFYELSIGSIVLKSLTTEFLLQSRLAPQEKKILYPGDQFSIG